MRSKRILAFDFGAESGRAIVGTLEDGRLSLTELSRFQTGYVEIRGNRLLNVLSYYQQILAGLKKYAQTYGPQLDSIGVDTWGCDFGLLDEQGRLLAIPYSYRDDKNTDTGKIIEEKMGSGKLYSLTGIQMLPINTLNQLIALRERGDAAIENASHLLYLGDLLHYFLTGKITMSYTVNSISQLYDPQKNTWADPVFDTFCLPKRLQRDIIHPGQIVGMLDEQIAKDCGLEPVPVIAPCIHDTASAAVAAPAAEPNQAILSSGTWSIACLDLERIVINEKAKKLSISNSGFAFGRNLFAKNVMGLWVLQSCRREWQKKHENLTYAGIADMAASAEPFRRWLDIDDRLFFNPENMLDAINRFFEKTGQEEVSGDSIGEIARTIYEGLVMKYRFNFERMASAAGVPVKSLNIIGGGCNNRLLNQFTANVMNIEVTVGPSEATAAGNIMMQATGLGLYGSLEEIREVIRNSFNIERFLPEQTELWNEKYKFYESRVFRNDA
jgi:rhamnulokinase